MSFEGRYQKLCTNGHYEEQDVYGETELCAICGQRWDRSNLVDDTNGFGEGYDESMVPPDPSIKLRENNKILREALKKCLILDPLDPFGRADMIRQALRDTEE